MQHLAPRSGRPVKFGVEISPVREVALFGTADLAFWQQQLAGEGLEPAPDEGRAQVLIIAAAAKFKGIPFRELSISILVGGVGEGGGQDAVFLPCAFNSLGLFACVERNLFHTPYYRGAVQVEAEGPATLAVDDGYGGLLSAAMSAADFGSRTPLLDGYHGWEGPIFLPASKRGATAGTKLFFAKIGGHTRTYDFAPASDVISIRPSTRHPIFGCLAESGFAGRQWHVRPAATHAKSKTMPRSAVTLQPIPV